MIDKSVNGKKWISTSIEKLKAYLTRAPIMVSNVIGTQDCQDGVFIIMDSLKKKLFFPFDYEMEPKAWVHNIKENLVGFYPRLIENITEEHILSPEEQALVVEKTNDLNNVPDIGYKIVRQNCWRIDKVLCYRDIFILYLEGSISNPDHNGEFTPATEPKMRRYKYAGSSVLLLKKYRQGNFGDVSEFSKDFFENSIPLDDVTVKDC